MANVVVSVHAGDAGYTKYLVDWGESPKYRPEGSPLVESWPTAPNTRSSTSWPR